MIYCYRDVKWSTNFRGLSFNVEMATSWLTPMNSFMWVQEEENIYEKCRIMSVICICYSFCGISSASYLLLAWVHFNSLDLLTFTEHKFGWLYINTVLTHLQTRLQRQCQKVDVTMVSQSTGSPAASFQFFGKKFMACKRVIDLFFNLRGQGPNSLCGLICFGSFV